MGGVFWRSYRRGAVRYTMACLKQAMMRRKDNNQALPTQMDWKCFLRLIGVAVGGASCMGVFFAVGEGVANLTGPSTVMSLSIAVLTALITAMCLSEVMSRGVWPSPYSCLYATAGEFAAFSVGWLLCLSSISAIAGVSRVLSSLINNMTKNYMRKWIGHFPGLLADIDPLAAGISVVSGIMVSAGLEESDSLLSALVFSVICATVMISGAGMAHGNWQTWEQQNFLSHGLSEMLVEASIMAAVFSSFYLFGCRSKVSRASGHVIKASGISILFSFAACTAVSVSLSSLIHYKLLKNTIAVIEVFDARKIEWAELGVGIASIFSLSLVVLEWLYPLNELIKQMSADQLLFQHLSMEYSYTGTRVLAIMVCVSLSALLAAFFPEGLLLRIFSIGLMTINMIFISVMIYQRYEVQERTDYHPFGGGSNLTCARWIRKKPSRRQRRDNKFRTLQYLKQGISALPTSMSLPNGFTFKNSHSGNLNTFEGDTTDLGDTGTQLESDKEHLLVRSPTHECDSGRISSSCEESDSSASGYETDSSSDTDIDAIVQEYKEKLKVATLTHADMPANRRREPTLVTSRRVAICILALLICFGSLSIVVSWEAYAHTSIAHAGVIILSLSIFLVIFLLLVLVSRQPEVPSHIFRVPLSPWTPAVALLLNTLLFANCICDTWPWLAGWAIIGLSIYFGYSIRHSTASSVIMPDVEPMPCQALVSAQASTSSSMDFSTLESDHAVTQIDTVLITR